VVVAHPRSGVRTDEVLGVLLEKGLPVTSKDEPNSEILSFAMVRVAFVRRGGGIIIVLPTRPGMIGLSVEYPRYPALSGMACT
jgi:hypothetical protein